MTALDDALNTSAPVYTPADIIADWAEDLPGESTNPNPDSLRILTKQSTGAYAVSHSLDDALPDPVTMTSGNDASTKATVGLNGRGEIYGQSIDWRTVSAKGTGSGTTLNTTLPTDSDWGDYSIVAVTLNTVNAAITEASSTLPYGWELLASESDGSGLMTNVYGRPWYSGGAGPSLTFSFSVTYAWVAVSAYARMADGTQVPWHTGTVVHSPEASVVSLHTAPTATLDRSGFLVGVWSAGTETWTAGAGTTELNEASGTVGVMVSSTPFQREGSQALTATTSNTTNVCTLITVPLVLQERPTMSPRAFFSPFNRYSPIYGRDRDTAETRIDFNVLGASGAIPTTIHRGQMSDITLSGSTAEMHAVSKTRLDLDRSLVLPEIWGQREGLTPDWIAAWIMARGGQFIGPAPTRYARYWNPFYGSTHAMLDGDSTIVTEGPNFTYRQDYDTNGAGVGPPSPTPRPDFVEGPFHTGVFACQTDEQIQHIGLELYPAQEGLPFLAGGDSLMADQFSTTNNIGRISFWVRGDALASNPAYLAAHSITNRDYGFRYSLALYDTAHVNFLGYLDVIIRSSDRYIQVGMGSTALGITGVFFSSIGALPTDGEWHFVGVAWDMGVGRVKVRLDDNETSSTYWQTNQPPTMAGWPVHDADRVPSAGDSDPINNLCFIHLPVSDLQIEAGQPWTDDFSALYPVPAAPSLTAITRPTGIMMQGLAESTPITGWSTLAELAQSTLSAYRTDEEDNFNFLPLGYFGETAQMTPTEIVDTEVNASDMDVTLDPTKTRNVVTVEFQETSISSSAIPVLSVTQGMEIPRGVSFVTFTLDTPAAELYGKSFPGSNTGGNWTFWNLLSTQIDGTLPPTSIGHYITVNTLPDGTGTVIPGDQVKARIMSATANTVVVRFTNLLLKSAWLANNGDNIAVLLIRGNALTTVDGYVTVRDEGSVDARRERSLDVQIPWLDNRDSATTVANWLVTMLARPRPELSVTTVGDPRRKPGQLVTLADAQGTQADGTWRILSVDHNVSGAQYTQDLALVYQLPIGLWDDLLGWDNEVWGE